MAARVLNQPSGVGCAFIDLAVVPVGSEIGIHTHNLDDQEIYIVISGSAEMTVEGATFAINAGDVVVNPPGGTHSLVNTGDTPIQLVVIDVAYRVDAAQD
jgi:mannose-6-phosphate isomerase-like protein (cupin superfamily)